METDPDISPALSDVIVKATAKSAAARYASAEKMKADLLRALREPEERFAYMDPDEVMEKEGDGGRKKPRHRAKIWHFVLPASLMVGLVVVMFVVWYIAMFGSSQRDARSKVPDVLSRTLEEATQMLSNRELSISVAGTISDSEYPEGTVCKQSPSSGTALDKGSTVSVWLSSGGTTVAMDGLVGLTLDEAVARLDAMRIAVDSISYDASEAEDGTVIWQSIPEGTEVVPGEETVSLIISGYQGRTLVPMPNLTRVTTIGGINQILDVYGVSDRRFRFGTGTKGGGVPTNGLVESQTPSAGLPFLPSETRVEIYLYPEYARGAAADVAFDILVDDEKAGVEVTLVSEYGEFLLYETLLEKSEQPVSVSFRAGYLQEGDYTLIVYMNGSEAMRLNAEFTEY